MHRFIVPPHGMELLMPAAAPVTYFFYHMVVGTLKFGSSMVE